MGDPRVLVIMGSGETAPTMAKVHRALFDRLGPGPVKAAIIDTPYGFQENAADLSARTVQFFVDRVGRPVSIATFPNRDVDAVTTAAAVAVIRESRYVMAGPGSPSYALRQWLGGPIPPALEDRLRTGGIVTMASAAALTLGAWTIPVYEIYKVGEAPYWLRGLDLLGALTGLHAAVVPHYDNAEGGNHDTRFCYIGERRLAELEAQLPDDAFVLGIDGHTALIVDLEDMRVAVAGRGGVTVRSRGRGTVLPSGSEIEIDGLAELARRLGEDAPVDIGWEPASAQARGSEPPGPDRGRLGAVRSAAAACEHAFNEAVARDDHRAMVASILDLDLAIDGSTRTGEDETAVDDARSVLHSMISRLAERPSAAMPDDGGPMG
ncbi:MAG: hypothetical protein EPO00_08215, partial [Chloroflexota bacterium]